MSDNLPNHFVEKLERRWAARVAGEADAWRSERPAHWGQRTVVTAKGRLVPVSFKGRRHPQARQYRPAITLGG
jgi:hypothetical protein